MDSAFWINTSPSTAIWMVNGDLIVGKIMRRSLLGMEHYAWTCGREMGIRPTRDEAMSAVETSYRHQQGAGT